jgi:hypothetical protein
MYRVKTTSLYLTGGPALTADASKAVEFQTLQEAWSVAEGLPGGPYTVISGHLELPVPCRASTNKYAPAALFIVYFDEYGRPSRLHSFYGTAAEARAHAASLSSNWALLRVLANSKTRAPYEVADSAEDGLPIL